MCRTFFEKALYRDDQPRAREVQYSERSSCASKHRSPSQLACSAALQCISTSGDHACQNKRKGQRINEEQRGGGQGSQPLGSSREKCCRQGSATALTRGFGFMSVGCCVACELQSQAGEVDIGIAPADNSTPDCRVDDHNVRPRGLHQHDKMVESPEQDRTGCQMREPGQVGAHSAAIQPVPPAEFEQPRCGHSVSTAARFFSKLLSGYVNATAGKDHAQTRGTAVGCRHLGVEGHIAGLGSPEDET